MEEIIKEWLCNLIDEEITQELGTISNERIWQKGSGVSEILMREKNIELHEKYIEILNEIKSKYGK